jgi:uncharacterized protein
VREAVRDVYKRLLAPSMETEIRLDTKSAPTAGALGSLRQPPPAPPRTALGEKNGFARVDPGIRTGCKIASSSGRELLHHDVITSAVRTDGTEAGKRIPRLSVITASRLSRSVTAQQGVKRKHSFRRVAIFPS